MKRKLIWAISNGLFVWLVFEAVQGSVGAGRLLCFFVWFQAVAMLLGAYSDEAVTKARARGRTVPAWLCHGSGYAIAGFLIWHGWIGCGIALILNELALAHIYDGEKKGGEV